MRSLFPVLVLAAMASSGAAATLERLTLDEMIQQSTAIVRGRVSAAGASQRGPMIYTRWRIQVAERWKGALAAEVEVVTPGGTVNGIRQSFSGVPVLAPGSQYVFFLWTGKNGLTHVVGLTQGLFELQADRAEETIVYRPASGETVLDPRTGAIVEDQPVRMRLSELSGRIGRVLSAAKQ